MDKNSRLATVSDMRPIVLCFMIFLAMELRAEPVQGTREFSPGVRINWKNQGVEVQAKVVLQKGPLELFACSPQTREHESILVVKARPFHIFQAMGLVGLRSGGTTHYDEKLDQWHPAAGEPLRLRVRWTANSMERTAEAESWMLEPRTQRPPEKLRWVFAGSRALEGDRFAADADGTVACVVDFESALIALTDRHSADNEQLWLAANPDAVPPVGTECTLLIDSGYHPKLDVLIEADGSYRLGNGKLSPSEVAGRLRPVDERRTPHLTVKASAEVSESAYLAGVEALRGELSKQLSNYEMSVQPHRVKERDP